MDAARTARRSADCTVIELDGRVSVFNPRTQAVHTLNASATAVWRLLDAGRDVEAVARAAAREYEVPVERVEQDVAAALRTLIDAGIVDECAQTT